MLMALPLVLGGARLSASSEFTRMVKFCWVSSEDVALSEVVRVFPAVFN